MTPLRLLDLFSGIGGFSLGLERSQAFKTVAFCEIDPFCRRVLSKHWPEVPICHDIRTMEAYRSGEGEGNGFIRARSFAREDSPTVWREPTEHVGCSAPAHNNEGPNFCSAPSAQNGDKGKEIADPSSVQVASGSHHEGANLGGESARRSLPQVRMRGGGHRPRPSGVAGRSNDIGKSATSLSSVPHAEISWREKDILDVGPIDVICGGFPCTDVSIANVKGRGLDGERSGLWFEYARLIGEIRPRFVIIENVAELLNRGMERVLGSLAAIGYDAEWRVFRSLDVGLPAIRERVWIVAVPQCEGRERRFQYLRSLGIEAAPSAERRDQAVRARRALDEHFSGLRATDGLSVTMERRRLHGLGNAVVPQIPELIGRAIRSAMEAA